VLPRLDGFGMLAAALAMVLVPAGSLMAVPRVGTSMLLLCINFILGLLNRLTPQLSIFVIGFPLTLTFGMLSLFLIAETLAPFFERLMALGFDTLDGLIQALV